MKVTTALAAVLICVPSLALAQGTTKDGATANEKSGQGTNTGASKNDKTMGPEKMAPTEGASSGASAGTSGDQKGMPPVKPNYDKSGSANQ